MGPPAVSAMTTLPACTDRKSTRLNSSHITNSYAVFCLKKKINEKHSIYGRYLHDHYDLIDPYGTFITSQLPTIPTNRLRPGSSYQVSYTWLISPTLINEAKINVSYNGQRIPPVCEFWKRATYYFFFPDPSTAGIYTLSLHDALPI